MTALRDELVAALRLARIDCDRAKNHYVSPYSGHEALVEYHRAWGHWSGIAKAIEILDAHEEAQT